MKNNNIWSKLKKAMYWSLMILLIIKAVIPTLKYICWLHYLIRFKWNKNICVSNKLLINDYFYYNKHINFITKTRFE